MQPGQQPAGLIPGAAGFSMTPAMQAFLGPGQIPGVPGHAILAQRLAVLPPGSRGGLAAASQAYRTQPQQVPMGMMQKLPNRKAAAGMKGRKSCNCKNSKCLKLYCECFASGRYCDNCNCLSCFNNKESEAVRQAAVESILERNPNAFRPKIQTAEGDTNPQSIRNAPDGSVRHSKGCNCKKSSCLKKYCECFQGGIFCTEICKCVDCKNFDGSEARAQVISHHGDSFSLQAAVAAAAAAQQQQALKRPRLQPQALSQASIMQQQLAAAAANAGPAAVAAAALQPLQQLQQLQALQAAGLALPGPAGQLQAASGPLASMPSAAGTAGLTSSASAAAALPQLPQQPSILDTMHDLVKPELVDEICSLLLIVAQEQTDKQQQQQQQLGGVVKTEISDEFAAAPQCNGMARLHGITDEGVDGGTHAVEQANTVPAVLLDQQGMTLHQAEQQQDDSLAHTEDGMSELYTAQEGVVLHEFNSILMRIIQQAEKKQAEREVSGILPEVAAEGADADAAAAAAAVMFDSMGNPVDGQHQHLLQQVADQLQQQQQDTLQQQQQLVKTLGSGQLDGVSAPQQQQQVLAAQQALLMQAAASNGNMALLQASRGLYLQNAQQQQQQQLMQPLLMQGTGGVQSLNTLRPQMQMVQVVANDGSLHQVPAHTLMSLQLAGLQQQQQQVGTLPQAAPAAQHAMSTAVPSNTAAAAPAAQQQPISLLSLLNGTGTTSGNSP